MNLSLEKPKLSDLTHFGVLGMHWGIRKPEPIGPGRRPAEAIAKTSTRSSKGKTAVLEPPKTPEVIISDLLKSKETEILKGTVDPTTGFYKITDGKVGIEQVNPDFSIFNPGTSMNCGNSTIALELRKRGLDVTAKDNPLGLYDLHMGQYFNLKPEAIKSIPWDELNQGSDIARGQVVRNSLSANVLKVYPEGARGSVFLPMEQGNHFIGWSIKDGRVLFEDAQNPKQNINAIMGVLSKDSFMGKRLGGAQFVRLDNAEINTSKIREVVKSNVFQRTPEGQVADLLADRKLDQTKIEGPGFVMEKFEYINRDQYQYPEHFRENALKANMASVKLTKISPTAVTYGHISRKGP